MGTRRYAILGTGALGGYYGARLHHAGLEVHFLCRSDATEARRSGLRVESPEGDFSIAEPHAYATANEMPPCDVAVVATKATANVHLREILPPVVAPGGTVLVMQNGLGVEAQAAAALPGVPVVGGLAFLCSNKVGPAHIRHLDYGAVMLGEYRDDGAPAGRTEPCLAIAADFERAGIAVRVEEDLLLARWKKLVWNAPFNGLTVVAGMATDRLMADPALRARAERIMREVVTVAEAHGRTIPPEFVTAMMTDTDRMAPYEPSMKLDFDRGRPLELEEIYTRLLRAAAAKSVDCPEITALVTELEALDRGARERAR